uniref:Ig-like domain-containing protein n=1 Tax=Gopherus agassizii TaxID=38772 RepID=A0A452HNB7_9SAUR
VSWALLLPAQHSTISVHPEQREYRSTENTAAVIVVNQTPLSIRAMEGSEFTIKCTFNTSNNSTRWFVEWNKIRNNVTEKVSNGTDRITSADKEKRSLSLTVKKASVTDCGTYVCRVGSKDVIYPGTGTQVTIEGKYQHFLLCSTKPFGELRTLGWFQGAGPGGAGGGGPSNQVSSYPSSYPKSLPSPISKTSIQLPASVWVS